MAHNNAQTLFLVQPPHLQRSPAISNFPLKAQSATNRLSTSSQGLYAVMNNVYNTNDCRPPRSLLQLGPHHTSGSGPSCGITQILFFLGHTWRSSGRQGLVNLTCPTMTAALWSFGGPSGDGDISLRGGHGNLQFSSVYIHNASSTTVLLQKYIQEWIR